MNPQCDCLQPLRSVKHGIKRRHHCRQDLRRADVRLGLLAADVLFPCLKSQPKGLPVAAVHGNADHAAWQVALERVPGRYEAGMRPAESEGNTEPLACPDCDVCLHRAGFLHNREGKEVGRNDGDGLCLVQSLNLVREVPNRPIGSGGLEKSTEYAVRTQITFRATDFDVDAERTGPSSNHVYRLRMAVAVNKEALRP